MNPFNINNLPPKSHIHFVGIGGINMSALSLIMKTLGYSISGSDIKSSEITDNLRKKNISIHIGHSASNVEGANLVVYTGGNK
jgi:UDP-N-acetylmuramate--alanine ligase